MSAILALLLAAAGFSALCMTLPRHQSDVLGRRLPHTRTMGLRAAGFALLAGSYLILAWRGGFGRGTVAWAGLATFAAAAVVAGLMVHARRTTSERCSRRR